MALMGQNSNEVVSNAADLRVEAAEVPAFERRDSSAAGRLGGARRARTLPLESGGHFGARRARARATGNHLRFHLGTPCGSAKRRAHPGNFEAISLGGEAGLQPARCSSSAVGPASPCTSDGLRRAYRGQPYNKSLLRTWPGNSRATLDEAEALGLRPSPRPVLRFNDSVKRPRRRTPIR